MYLLPKKSSAKHSLLRHQFPHQYFNSIKNHLIFQNAFSCRSFPLTTTRSLLTMNPEHHLHLSRPRIGFGSHDRSSNPQSTQGSANGRTRSVIIRSPAQNRRLIYHQRALKSLSTPVHTSAPTPELHQLLEVLEQRQSSTSPRTNAPLSICHLLEPSVLL